MQNLITEDRQLKIKFHCSLIIFHPHDCKLLFESSSSAIIPVLSALHISATAYVFSIYQQGSKIFICFFT